MDTVNNRIGFVMYTSGGGIDQSALRTINYDFYCDNGIVKAANSETIAYENVINDKQSYDVFTADDSFDRWAMNDITPAAVPYWWWDFAVTDPAQMYVIKVGKSKGYYYVIRNNAGTADVDIRDDNRGIGLAAYQDPPNYRKV